MRKHGVRIGVFATLVAVLVSGAAGVQERRMELSSGAAGTKRTALVIGNGAYQTSPLKNPVNDATDMAARLRALGFEVTLKVNAGKRDMEEAIRVFGDTLKGGGVGMFYFAGHGMQVGGRNYLIPVDARIETQSDVEYEGVDAGRVLGKMEDAGNAFNIVVLDACRNNPFGRGFRDQAAGLAQVTAPTGSFIAYATAPGSVAADGEGRNGAFTAALLEALNEPGLSVEGIFKRVRERVARETGRKQVPWDSSSLVGEFYFTSGAKKTEPVKSADGVVIDPKAVEAEYWNTIKESASPRDFEAYLKEYPNGAYASLARLRISKLRAAAKPEPAAPGAEQSFDIGGGQAVAMVLIQPGTFVMGSENGDVGEKPMHRVTIGKAYYVGKYEVTQGQWEAVMGTNPSYFKGDSRLPVESVSWADCQEFLRKLNSITDGRWRLLTEAEWEYACRAGSTGDYAGNLDDIAWYGNNSGRTYIDAQKVFDTDPGNYTKRVVMDNAEKTHPVGTKRPNGWGLYDMHGNVWEWCSDWYGEYTTGEQVDPQGPSGYARVDRGGGWGNSAARCRSASRDGNLPDSRNYILGLRLARTVQ